MVKRLTFLLNLFRYFLIKEIKARYAGSFLGLLWTIFVPLMQIALYWGVFAKVMKIRAVMSSNVPYIYFLLSSFFFWLAFSDALGQAGRKIIDNGEIVKKVSFPLVILPITAVSTNYLLNFIGFLFFLVAYIFSFGFHGIFFLVLPVLFLQFIFSVGLGMILSSLLPYVRDIEPLVGYILQAMFFGSPILYDISSMSTNIQRLFYLNPLTFYVDSYHKILLLKQIPSISAFGIMFVTSSVFFFLGIIIFKRLKGGFADVL